MSGAAGKSAREEIRELVLLVERTRDDADEVAPHQASYVSQVHRIVDTLLTRIERQAEAIVKLERHVRALDERTHGLARVGGR